MNDYQQPTYTAQPVNPYDYDGTKSKGSNGCRNLAIGCGLVVLLGFVMAAVGAFFVARNIKPMAAKTVVATAEEVLKETDLPPEQKQHILRRVEELGEDFAEGDLTFEDMGTIVKKLVENRKIVAGGVEFVIQKAVESEMELTEEQEQQLQRLVQRLARGIVEERLQKEDFEPVMEVVMVKTGENSYEVRDDLSEEDIAKFLTEMETMVDNAEIPDEPYEIDLITEIDRVIEEVRSGE